MANSAVQLEHEDFRREFLMGPTLPSRTKRIPQNPFMNLKYANNLPAEDIADRFVSFPVYPLLQR